MPDGRQVDAAYIVDSKIKLNSADLSKAQIDALLAAQRGNTFNLNSVDAKDTGYQGELFAALKQQLDGFNKQLKVTFGQTPGLGQYNPHTNTITLNKAAYDSLDKPAQLALLNHELIHALTEHNLHNKHYAKHADMLNKMRKQLLPKADTDKLKTALASTSEMVAYGLTDPDVMRFIEQHLDLKALGIKAPSRISAIANYVYNLFLGVLGLGKAVNVKAFVNETAKLLGKIDFNQQGDIRQSANDNVKRGINAIKQALTIKQMLNVQCIAMTLVGLILFGVMLDALKQLAKQ